MRRSKFNPTQIARVLKEFEQGKESESLCREYGISNVPFTTGIDVMVGWKPAS
jgi:putative transposase